MGNSVSYPEHRAWVPGFALREASAPSHCLRLLDTEEGRQPGRRPSSTLFPRHLQTLGECVWEGVFALQPPEL